MQIPNRAPVAALVPLLFLAVMLPVRQWAGPFWRLLSFDPDYVYLLNAQRMAQFDPPVHIDHPGTPVQALGALVLRLCGASDASVVESPERYLTILAWLCCLLYAAALWWLGRTALAAGVSPGWAVAAQAAPLLSAPILLEATMRFNPEPVLLALAVAIGAILFRDRAAPDWRTAALCGVCAGLAVACKVNFLGVAVGLLLAFPLRLAFLYGAAALLTAAFAIFPMWDRLGRLFEWMFLLAFRTDHYGAGAVGLFDPERLPRQLLRSLWVHPALTAALVFGVRALWLTQRSPEERAKPTRRVLLGLIAAAVLQVVMAAKFEPARYAAPALGLAGAILLLAQYLAPPSARWRVAGLAAVAAAFAVAFAIKTTDFIQRHSDFRLVRDTIAENSSDCLLIASYRTSDPRFALAFADDYAAAKFTPLLRQIYPGFVEHNVFQQVYRAWDRKQDLSEMFWRRGCAVERGWSVAAYQPPAGAQVTRELSGTEDAIRILEPTELPKTCEIRYGDGWYGRETFETSTFRWSQQDGFIVVASPEDMRLTVTATQISDSPANRVETRWNGKEVGAQRHTGPAGIPVRYDLEVRKGWNRLWIHSEKEPAQEKGSPRRLAFRWVNVQFSAPGCKTPE